MDLLPVPVSPHVVMTHSGLLLAGYSPHEIRHARQMGDLTPLVRGSYAWGPSYRESSPEGKHLLLARSRALGSPSVVLSHVSAAVLHGLPVPRETLSTIHLTRPGRGGSRRSAGMHQHAGLFGNGDVVTKDGVEVTSLPRTLVDLSRLLSFENAVVAADVALRADTGVVVGLPHVLYRARHLPGVGPARRALAFADGRAESPGESRTRVALHHADLPAPELQLEIFDECGSFVGRVDLAIPSCGVIVEFDGMVKYGDLLRGNLTPQQVLVKEKRREDALRGLGWLVVRVTWAELADGRQFASRLTAAVARGRRLVELGGLTGTSRRTAPIRIGGN